MAKLLLSLLLGASAFAIVANAANYTVQLVPNTTTTSRQYSTDKYPHRQPDDYSVYGFASMAQSFRMALQGDASTSILRGATSASGTWDSTATITQFVPLIVTGSFCLLVTVLITFITPCVALGFWRDVRKTQRAAQAERDKERDQLLLKQDGLKPEEEREVQQRRKQREADTLAENIVYSREERLFAVGLMAGSTLLVVLCLVYGLAGNSLANNALARFSVVSQNVLQSMENFTASAATATTAALSTGVLRRYADALPAADTTDFNTQVFAHSTGNVATLTAQYLQLQQLLTWYAGNLSAVQPAVDQLTQALVPLAAAGGSTGTARGIMVRSYTSSAGTYQCNYGLSVFNPIPTLYVALDTQAPSATGALDGAQTAVAPYNLSQSARVIQQAQDVAQQWASSLILTSLRQTIGNYSDAMQLTAPATISRVTALMRRARNAANYHMAWVNDYNRFRSNVTYAALILAMMFVLASVGALTVRRTQVAAGVNVASFFLVGVFWALCIMAVTYSVVDAHFCKEMRSTQQLAGWIPFMQNNLNLTTDPRYTLNLTSYVPTLFAARDACFNGNAQPLQDAVGVLSASMVTQNSSSAQADQVRAMLSTSDQLADTLVTPSLAVSFDLQMAQRLKTLYAVVRANLNTTQHAAFNTAARKLLLTNYAGYQQLTTLPVLFEMAGRTPRQMIVDTINAVLATTPAIYASGGTNIAQADAQCAAELRSLQTPLLVAEVTQLMQNLTNAVQSARTTIATSINNADQLSSQITTLYAATKQSWDAASVDISATEAPLVRAAAASTLKVSVASMAQEFQAPLRQTLSDCRQIAEWTYEAEDLTCATAQTGLDTLLWALGALGVLYFVHVMAVRMCVPRIEPNSQWLVIALLLERQYRRAVNGSNSNAKTLTLPRANGTGTTYLTEADFDVEFGSRIGDSRQ